MTAAHTPTPWKQGRRQTVVADTVPADAEHASGHQAEEYYGGKFLIAESIWRAADAAFIVRAVNNHAALLGALKEIVVFVTNRNYDVARNLQ